MNSPKTAVVLAVVSLLFGCGTSRVGPIETSRHDEFAGSTPCHALARDFLRIPSNAACECIQWQLKLHSSDVAGRGTYTLVTTHGVSETNGHGFFQNGTRTETTGQWITTIGNPDTTVYQLQATAPNRSLSLVKIDENLLHLLTHDRQLMVGNDSWSCTLNRIPKQP
jgi:hypothetical protein